MLTLIYITLANLFISLASLIGIFTIKINHEKIQRSLNILLALAAGTMLGGAFLHLLPEATEQLSQNTTYIIVLISFVVFFLIEKVLHWRHCHDDECATHPFGYMNLIGDAIHNFIDGAVIAGAFATSVKLGFTTSAVIALHELPQEIGDFGVLLYSGFSKKKAVILNLLVSMTAILGGIFGYLAAEYTSYISYLIPFAAGGFIYIATSDLIPELRNEKNKKRAFITFLTFILGITIMFITAQFE